MQTITMKLGERRRPKLRITSPEPFVLRDASYELTFEGRTVDSGVPVIEDSMLIVMLEPLNAGVHYLKYTYTVGYEVLKTVVLVNVIKEESV